MCYNFYVLKGDFYMETFILTLEEILYYAATLVALVIEIIGLIMIVYTLIKGIKNYINEKFSIGDMTKDPTINHGLSVSLEILLASEIIKTITVGNLSNLITVVILVLIRLFMAYMLHVEGAHKGPDLDNIKKIEKQIETKVTNNKKTSKK